MQHPVLLTQQTTSNPLKRAINPNLSVTYPPTELNTPQQLPSYRLLWTLVPRLPCSVTRTREQLSHLSILGPYPFFQTSENSNQPQILNKKRNYNSERRPSSSKFRKTPSTSSIGLSHTVSCCRDPQLKPLI
ncbi:hypothetical protein PGT21_007748 [Puccinia graminis f. sp. tritici]|uniref:Uncharacterized protein n=1 Tax=Puccinia graminis f. sp. tritici TaxID=56615 RepID=A0A5B0MEC5_PUCGR|nr:hypothetical protein PGT21_007748 [Puccinia graminis f. sp. tritici]